MEKINCGTAEERGFKCYGKFVDTYGSTISVQESSTAGRPRVWIMCHNDPKVFDHDTPILSVSQAKKLIKILERFVKHSESPKNWRNKPQYRATFG